MKKTLSEFVIFLKSLESKCGLQTGDVRDCLEAIPDDLRQQIETIEVPADFPGETQSDESKRSFLRQPLVLTSIKLFLKWKFNVYPKIDDSEIPMLGVDGISYAILKNRLMHERLD